MSECFICGTTIIRRPPNRGVWGHYSGFPRPYDHEAAASPKDGADYGE